MQKLQALIMMPFHSMKSLLLTEIKSLVILMAFRNLVELTPSQCQVFLMGQDGTILSVSKERMCRPWL